MRVVLADLGHNQVTQSSDIYPLGIANVTIFGEHPAGLGKFTRTLFAHDLRRSLVTHPAGATTYKELAS